MFSVYVRPAITKTTTCSTILYDARDICGWLSAPAQYNHTPHARHHIYERGYTSDRDIHAARITNRALLYAGRGCVRVCVCVCGAVWRNGNKKVCIYSWMARYEPHVRRARIYKVFHLCIVGIVVWGYIVYKSNRYIHTHTRAVCVCVCVPLLTHKTNQELCIQYWFCVAVFVYQDVLQVPHRGWWFQRGEGLFAIHQERTQREWKRTPLYSVCSPSRITSETGDDMVDTSSL